LTNVTKITRRNREKQNKTTKNFLIRRPELWKKSNIRKITVGEKQFKISFIFPAIPISLREENSLSVSVAEPGQSRRMRVAFTKNRLFIYL